MIAVARRGLVTLLVVGFTWGPPLTAMAQDRIRDNRSELAQNEMREESDRAPIPAYLDKVVDPGEYRVGPGDRLAINIWGEQPQQFTVTVTPEATLIIPTVGELLVTGMTLTEVKAAAIRRLGRFYPNTSKSVTLTGIRRFRVTVTGAVSVPGFQIVTANTRASEALTEAGLGETSRRRGIELKRAGETVLVDLDRFERLGHLAANPYLAESDILVVPAKDRSWGTLEISGAVHRGGKFEYLPGDRLGDLLDLAYGLTPDADTTRLQLWRFSPDADVARVLAWPEGSSYSQWRNTPLSEDDRVVIRQKEGYRPKHSVRVFGEVVRPGQYIFARDSILLRAVFDSAGGFTQEADLHNAIITRPQPELRLTTNAERAALIPPDLRTQAEDDLLLSTALSVSGRVVTDFDRLFNSSEEAHNIALLPGDEVFVPRHTASVNVMGRVVQPGLVAHQGNASLSYYLERAGGYGWRADKGGTFLLKGATGAAVKRKQIREITAGDMIVVPTRRGRNLWRTVRETMVVLSSLATVYLVIDQATQ